MLQATTCLASGRQTGASAQPAALRMAPPTLPPLQGDWSERGALGGGAVHQELRPAGGRDVFCCAAVRCWAVHSVWQHSPPTAPGLQAHMRMHGYSLCTASQWRVHTATGGGTWRQAAL